MKRQYIAISQRLYSMQEYNEVRESLALDWGQFFTEYLHDFLMLPLSYKQDITPYLPYIAGIILSGGNDLSIFNDTHLNRERDVFETNIIELCIRYSIPLLGICRGAQMIAHYFDSQITPCINHVGLHEVEQNLSPIHSEVSVESRTQTLEGLEATQRFRTNSFHNYAITQLGKELEILAICNNSNDLSIEAFKHKFHNIIGIMWHIEREMGMPNSDIFQYWKNTLCKDFKNKDM
ncbi:gamma-glutamyl-gamma-aminobutyrate hydrolase family protein [Helicobacter trogontum]|uniref:Uncharacterized protein n=1 Tax=Helicobacter trogontum TaxID=50960 RepID=A0A4U8SAK5_9HELI|nr:gamma-glutamyl-gamma-aminobutyrate hydrolase family protein [Helicobacter trogontum]TLD83016.1 hypothetical protein LS81_006090 [Helicobacter trogontum]